ncbi:glycosyltransferase family 1 protein [Granulimonas faecalis]|uniref:glycosyltransferase family 1 protein n=1 Tax=Granulimonas faecalis TaxID=2894155 RepID=UPI003512F382
MIEKADSPVRVLHVLQRMEAGGTQAFLMNLYRNIDRSKVQFDFLVEYEEKEFYDDEIESLGGRVYRSNFREDKNLPRFVRFLRGFFGSHSEYAVVHCHAYTIGYFVLREAERAGVAVRIAHSHENNMYGVTVPLKVVMRSLFPIHANKLMACSDEAGRFLFGDRNYTVVKNAIDVDRYVFDETVRTEVRRELGLGSSLVVGSVGRLHHQKNQAFLLDAFREVAAMRPDARLLLVGNGPLREKIIAKASDLGIADRMILLSDRRDMDRLYQAMDVFVLPSFYEGLGIVAVEAQSSGLPTICSGGVAEDANVSPLFRRMMLEESPKAWAETIIKSAGVRDCAVGAAGARAHGFDVRDNAMKMQEWYLAKAANAR